MDSALKPYVELKREMLRAGLLSCSQVGFNIAMGPLTGLRDGLSALFARVFAAGERWETPPLIRADWIPAGAWDNPGDDQWIRTTPLGHVLTPLPAMHLLNRLRHHPQAGTFHLSGWCFRQELDTLPLLRQVSFAVHERVQVEEGSVEPTGSQVFAGLAAIAGNLDLPVREESVDGPAGARIILELPDTPVVPLAAHRRVQDGVLRSYGLERFAAHRLSCGIERWCLAIVARHGAGPAGWPDLGSVTTAG